MKIGNLDITSLKVGSADCKVYLGSVQVYPNSTPIISGDYLTFVAKEDGTFKFSGNAIDYSLDSGSTWTALNSNTDTPTIHSGETIMWRATITPTANLGVGRFYSSGNFDVEGNPMSLLYGDNFEGQTSLSGKTYAFYGMFSGCTHLLSAERMKLPATTLANNCYQRMFNGSTSLTAAPELPATTLTNTCYQGMFQGCSSLTAAPELPATNLGYSSYAQMFYGCTSLTVAPQLPSTTIANDCYGQMFYGCTALTESPILMAETLRNGCYAQMFRGCSGLNKITCLATSISATNCTANWTDGVAANGTFIKKSSMTGWTIGVNGIPSGWTVRNDSYDANYLAFIANEDGQFKFSGNTVDYSLDSGSTWTSLSSDTYTPTVQSGHTIMWKATLTPTANVGIGRFSSSGSFDVDGNPLSLIYGDNFVGQTDLTGKNYCFYNLFSACHKLESAERLSLPATTLANSCYYGMFSVCWNLINTPELPATTLADGCYQYMFQGCASLTTPPELPATTLASSCYYYMFSGCASLTTPPELPATTLANFCYGSMFGGCTALTTAPELHATELAGGCYGYMFNGCTSLTTAPELPATTLKANCYGYMFQGCTGLTAAPELPATTLANWCYSSMFQGCSGLITAPVLPATTLTEHCYDYMFYNCTLLTTAPVLSATTLASYCYGGMFGGCTSLNKITCLATDISAYHCTYGWVDGVAANGTFTKNPNMSNWTSGIGGIPHGWTVQDYV